MLLMILELKLKSVTLRDRIGESRPQPYFISVTIPISRRVHRDSDIYINNATRPFYGISGKSYALLASKSNNNLFAI